MAKCSFCLKQIESGRGMIYVALDKVYNFCSSKCMKNFNLGRDKRKLAWVRKIHKGKAEIKKELLEEVKETKEKEAKETAEPELMQRLTEKAEEKGSSVIEIEKETKEKAKPEQEKKMS